MCIRDSPKNIVVMICDDLGYGDLGCYGSGIKTPNLDKLAADGARFNHCNSAHPICSASRAALLTGRYGQRSGTTSAFFPTSKYGLALEETTLANLFKESGYRTMAIGKWHLGDAPEFLPTKRGFDSFFGVPYSDDMEPLPMIRDAAVIEAETDRDLLTPRYTEAVSYTHLGRKASTFEGGFRIPFLAKWSGMIDPGQVDGEWHSSLDILPSLVALCGLGLPEKPLDGVDMSGILGGREKNAAVEQKSRLYFSPMGKKGLELHCIRKRNWKLRVAQGIEGEIYTNDRTTSAKDSAWLQHPELYDLLQDPAESYDVAKLHPEIVAELTREIETLMPTFPPDVVQAYAELQQNKGDISTPPGASPRPFGARLSPGSWEPQDRR